MNTLLELGPTFASVKRQPDPCRLVTDLGINMSWGYPARQKQARLYWNGKEYPSKIRTFEQVVLHEEDARGDFLYNAYQSRVTSLGTFYPLTAYLRQLYALGQVNRELRHALAELGHLLPKLSTTTRHPGRLRAGLENEGFDITGIIQDQHRLGLDVGWTTPDGNASYRTGILEFKPTTRRTHVKWIRPGIVGVNHLLMVEVQRLCPRPADCITPEFHRELRAVMHSSTASTKGHESPEAPLN